jgi:hypothetical protein
MKCADEMGSGAMIYIPSFINIGSGIQKLTGGGGFREKQAVWRSHNPTYIFQNKGSRLKTNIHSGF